MIICYRKGLVSFFPHVKGLVPFSASEKSYGNKEWDSLGMLICYRKGLVLLFPHVRGLSSVLPSPGGVNTLVGRKFASIAMIV